MLRAVPAALLGGKMLKKIIILFSIALMPPPAVAGPISKFDEKKPDIEQVSTVPLFDLERCLIDMDDYQGAFIYRQPDRPHEVNILWVWTDSRFTIARAHLKVVDGVLAVRVWIKGNLPRKQFKSCVETGKSR
jgi:hypothetical protein